MAASSAPVYSTPVGGASLLLSFKMLQKTMLIVGANLLAASRAFTALEADSKVVVLATTAVCDEIKWRATQKQIELVDASLLPSSSANDGASITLSYIRDHASSIDLVCITDTLIGADEDDVDGKKRADAYEIRHLCKTLSIPINVTDMPNLCDFSFTATHRFVDRTTQKPTPLQIAITTNGQGCRLASRVRRDIVSSMHRDAGAAVQKMGLLRAMAKGDSSSYFFMDDGLETSGVTTPNRPVPIRARGSFESAQEQVKRRMRWVAQVSEYWPMGKLANMSASEMQDVLNGDDSISQGLGKHQASIHSLQDPSRTGKILLVGSGPGHPSLLTAATHRALTTLADVVLSDKLVPAAVLDLIPPHVDIRIARKFPGNADGAQTEMMEMAIDAAKQGKIVVRLKQGDPIVYGRAGEEVLYFRSHGFEPVIIPGVSSALAAPVFAGIPVTQRGVAESFIVCTGAGRKGKEVQLPGYERGRTLVILMGVARLPQVISALTDQSDQALDRRAGPAYPPHLPIAIIERGSMPDQRVTASTLRDIEAALDSVGEQRPPGMIIVGWAVSCLHGQGDVTVLEESPDRDEERSKAWLGSSNWKVIEGIDDEWTNL